MKKNRCNSIRHLKFAPGGTPVRLRFDRLTFRGNKEFDICNLVFVCYLIFVINPNETSLNKFKYHIFMVFNNT